MFFQLFTTLLVTSSTPEQIFSVQKRLKTYPRSTVSEERFNELALANINKMELINEDEVIDYFSNSEECN